MSLILTHSQALAVVTAAAYLNNVGGVLSTDIKIRARAMGEEDYIVRVFERKTKHFKFSAGSVQVIRFHPSPKEWATLQVAETEAYESWDAFSKAYNV